MKPRTRRRCLACLAAGLLAAAAVFVAVTSRRGPDAGPMPEVLVQAWSGAPDAVPEVQVTAERPAGLLAEVVVRPGSRDPVATAPGPGHGTY